MRRKLVVALSALALCVTAVVPVTAQPAQTVGSGAGTISQAPTDPTDPTRIPHYFGPYPNWANSPQVLANAVVEISLGTPTPVTIGNPLVGRAFATDFVPPPIVVPASATPAATRRFSATVGSAIAGTFTLSVDGATTADIAWNAAAADVAGALSLLAGISATATGTGSIADPWIIAFAVAPATVTMDPAFLKVPDAGVAPAATDIYNVSVGSFTGGTFTLSVDGAPTAAIAWNATAADVATALSLVTGGTSTATGTGAIADPWIVTFAVAPATVTIDGTALTQIPPVDGVFVVLPNATLPAGTLQSFQAWNQVTPGGSPGPSAGNVFNAYVLRPTATPNEYTVVYDSGPLTVPVSAIPAGEVATFTVPAVTVQLNDVIGFYGRGIPVDTGITVSPDTFSHPATADPALVVNQAPAVAATIGIGVDPGFPLPAVQDRTYSFAASVLPTVTDPGSGAQATATVDPKTGGISAITVTSPGQGYLYPPTVTITSPGVTPSALASATAQISTGVITGITVDESGFGFTAPAVTISGGGTPSAPATAQASGGVDDLTLTSGGSGYAIQPIVVISLPDLPGGVQATGSATMTAGVVDGVSVVDPGSGYTSAPTVTILDGDQVLVTAATATATIGIGAIAVTSGGAGYDSPPTVTIADTGLGTGRDASATAVVAVLGAVTGITVTNPGAGYLTPGLKKFVDTLPGLGPTGVNDLGQYIPVGVPDTTTYPGTDYYEIGVVQYRMKFHRDLPATLLRGYVQLTTPALLAANPTIAPVALSNANLNGGVTPIVGYTGVDSPHYLGPTIVAEKDKPVRIVFRNLLPTGVAGDLFMPVDTSLMGAGTGPAMMQLDANSVPLPMAPDEGLVTDGVRNPVCGETPKPVNVATGKTDCFTENRATLHLHGGITPWISDGTPHQWITPAGENATYPTGVSVSNVPDMPDPGPGAMTFFYTNQQSARLMFYHDHAWGITRLNVYAGEAAGYLVTDAMEQSLIAPGGALDGLGLGTPLIVQDKTFVPSVAQMAKLDPTWQYDRWGGEGNLWVPHVYMPAQNPGDPSGMSAFGRWMYGPWFWPPAKTAEYPPIANPYFDPDCDPNVQPFCEPALIPSTPNVSVGMEAFNDTPIVNGTAYPTTTVDPKAYRYRVLNAANDRFWNLSWYVADPTTGTLSEVALNPAELAAAQTDPVTFPTPDTTKSPKGPNWIQIGSEGGFLPTPVVVPAQPTTWITDPTRFDVGNVDQHSLLLAPAERADVIVDFSQFRGKTLILYNDAPAAFPARVPGYDYYTGGPDLSPSGAPTTLPGYGPNTRTVMQVKVSMAAPATAWDRPNTTNDRLGTLMAAFAHHADGSGVFESGSDPIIVGQAPYNTAYGTDFVTNGWCNSPTNPSARCDGYARIAEGSQPTDKFGFNTLLAPGDRMQVQLEPKGIHDEMNSASFDEWGRMTANMGLEAPGATPLLQNIILYPYVNPSTENLDSTGLPSSLHVTPIASGADGTQIWKITHNGVDTHPLHFHLYNVQVINRVTWDNIIIPPDPTELGWKETVRVSPLEDTYVAVRPIAPTLPFGVLDSKRPLNPMMPIGARGSQNGALGIEAGFNNTDANGNPIAPIVNQIVDFAWEYVWHCHILSHEEMDMMRPQEVYGARTLPEAPELSSDGTGPANLSWNDLTPVDYLDPTTWGDPKAEVGYRIERATITDGVVGEYSTIAIALANQTNFLDTTAVVGVDYSYRVVVFNAAGDAISNAIAVTPASSILSGTFTAGGVPQVGGGVYVFLASSYTYVGAATVDGTGSYSIALAPGTYKLYLAPVTAGYGLQWYGAADFAGATTITVSGNTTQNIALVNAAPILSGTFTAGGVPQVGGGVYVFLASSYTYVGAATVDGTGSYSIALAPGTYKLYLAPVTAGYGLQWYGAADFAGATTITVSGNTTQNIALQPLLSGTFTAGGVPQVGGGVYVFLASSYTYVGAATVDGTGSYSIALAPGTYKLYLAPVTAGYGLQWYGADFAGATTITVSGNTTQNIALVNAAPILSGTFTAGGVPQVGGGVYVFLASSYTYVGAATVDGTGSYSIALAPGTYKLYLAPVTAGYGLQWYGAADFAGATTITVSGNTTQNIALP